MALLNIKWDGMGFTSEEDKTDLELTTDEATALTKEMRAAGLLPPGVIRIVHAGVSPDNCEDGEWKVFVCVELIVEADSERAAEMSEAPEAFLLLVADKMVEGDANSEYGVGGSFEVLEVYPADDDEVVAGTSDETSAPAQAMSILASQAVAGQWLVYDNERMNQRIVDVSAARDGQIRIHADYGNGGEPATVFFDADETVRVTAAPLA